MKLFCLRPIFNTFFLGGGGNIKARNKGWKQYFSPPSFLVKSPREFQNALEENQKLKEEKDFAVEEKNALEEEMAVIDEMKEKVDSENQRLKKENNSVLQNQARSAEDLRRIQ